jgi:uncharacterized protein DUF6894
MQRYFFDIASGSRSIYDYQGREFSARQEAFELAELIALDLELNVDGEWGDCRVAVRDVEGRNLFSVPVRELDLIAA